MILIGCAAIGLPVSIASHLLVLAGFQPGGISFFIVLMIGSLLSILPRILIVLSFPLRMKIIKKDHNFGEHLAAIICGCPDWMKYRMKYLIMGLYIYCFINFVINMFAFMALSDGKPMRITNEVPIVVWRYFSGFWMILYAAGLASLITWYRRGFSALERAFFDDVTPGPWG
jgi:hypothetical protein